MTRLERLEAIAELAGKTVAAQKRYFRTRTKPALVEAKQLEAKLETALATHWELEPEGAEKGGTT